MHPRLFEVLAALGAPVVAALTAGTVPFDDLGVWAAGTLGSLVVVGALACVLSWPPRFAGDPPAPDASPGSASDEVDPRPPWRLLYLIPALTVAVLSPTVVRGPPAGLSGPAAIGLLLLLAYVALLAGAAVFLVVLLPLSHLGGTASRLLQGRPVSAYVPLGALLVLAITGLALGGAFALAGLPDDAVGLIFLLAGVVGLAPPGVTVVSAGALLVARLSGVVVVGCAVGLWITGKRTARPDPRR